MGVLFGSIITKKDIFKSNNEIDYYTKIYDENYEGFKNAKKNLLKINNYCLRKNIRCKIIYTSCLKHQTLQV